MSLQVLDVIKFADLDYSQLSEELKTSIDGMQTYTDKSMEEHLYNPDELLDKIGEGELPESIQEELETIKKLLDKRGCAYFRVIIP